MSFMYLYRKNCVSIRYQMFKTDVEPVWMPVHKSELLYWIKSWHILCKIKCNIMLTFCSSLVKFHYASVSRRIKYCIECKKKNNRVKRSMLLWLLITVKPDWTGIMHFENVFLVCLVNLEFFDSGKKFCFINSYISYIHRNRAREGKDCIWLPLEFRKYFHFLELNIPL